MGNPIQEQISDVDGLFTFSQLPHGTYMIKEIESPEGYILTDQIITVEIKPDQLHVSLENVEDQYLKNMPIVSGEMDNPNTGDNSRRNALFVMIICSGFGIYYLMRIRGFN